ncbi:MAG: PD40 domain-containing protein [Chloroflexi bacterium]|nr:PD40 domain-containing protein [Chloroflexota bacterium]
MTEKQKLPTSLSIGVIIIFVATVLGVCSLVVFLYNLPLIFPPPGGNRQVAGLSTLLPTETLTLETPTLLPSPSETPNAPTLEATPPPPTVAPSTGGVTPPLPPPSATPLPPPPTVAPSAGGVTPPLPPTAAPSSGRIVFVTERNGSSIYVMNFDGSGQRLLVPHKGNSRDFAPAVSPDGRRLAFASSRDDGADIFVMNMDGTRLAQLTNTRKVRNVSPSWFPDSNRVAFTSNRSGSWKMYTMNADGSGAEQFLENSQDVLEVAVSPDGNRIAYTCGKEICLANADRSDRRVLLRNGLPKEHLAWSPDSRLLAFTQSDPKADRTSVYAVDLQGRTRPIVHNAGMASWSPEGDRIVFSSDIEGVANLYSYDLDSGQVRRLTTGAPNYASVWMP